MARLPNVPTMLKHRPSGLARVRIAGKDIYLGRWGSAQALANYHRRIAEWMAAGQTIAPASADPLKRRVATIAELAAAFLAHAAGAYSRRELSTWQSVLRYTCRLYSDLAVEELGPLALKAVRQTMIEAGLARRVINRYAGRIKHVVAWAGENELIDPAIPHRLLCVKGLRRGQGGRETPRRRPVAQELVDAIRLHVSAQVWALVQIQWHTGARPGELVIMRTGDLDMSGRIWRYQPESWKSQHREDLPERVIAVGPEAQQVLRSWLRPALNEYCFQPAEAERARRQNLIAARAARGGVGSHKPRSRPSLATRKPGERYTTASLRRAIDRACELAFPPPADLARGRVATIDRRGRKRSRLETPAEWKARLGKTKWQELLAWRKAHRWTPHQVRHTFATRVRKRFNLDAARAALGHAGANVTLDYAELDRQQAERVAAAMG